MPDQSRRRRPRPAHLGLGAASAVLALALAGCSGGADADPTASTSAAGSSAASPASTPTSTSTASMTASPDSTGTAPESVAPTSSPSVSPTSSGPTSSAPASSAPADAGLPSADLQQGPYEGEPRRLAEVFHLECLRALDGEDLPEREDAEVAEDEKPVWRVHSSQALTAGWKACPTQMYGQIAIPAAFGVQAAPGQGSIETLRISDASGQRVGGVDLDVSGGAPQATELLEVVDIAEAAFSPAYGEEVPYLRTLVVQTGSGPQLLVDLVSAPEGTAPDTLEVWDLAAFGGAQRDAVYASIPLDSPEDAEDAVASDLYAVLRAMVGSYTLPVH